MTNEEIYNLWDEEGSFSIDNDKLKGKKFIFSSIPLADTYGFQTGKIRPLIYGDVLARFERLQNNSVLFPLGCNTLCNSSFIESRRTANKLNDNISEIYFNEMKKLGLGINNEKLMDMRHDEYLSNLQLDFIDLYEHGYIEYKTVMVSQGENNKIYDSFFSKNKSDLKPYKAFVLKLDSVVDGIISDIKELDVSNEIKNKMISFFNESEIMYIPFMLPNGKDIKIKIDNPEELGAASFIFINPKIIDVMPYVDINEKESIKRLLNENLNSFLFTGFTVRNPLTGNEIPVFISSVYDEAVHLGLPIEGINEYDLEIARDYEFEVEPILDENGLLINSDFLDGNTLQDAKIKVMEAFKEDGIAVFERVYTHKEVLISQTDHFGALFPFLSDGDSLYSLKEYLPYSFSVQFRPILDSKADVPGDHMDGSINSPFTVGMAPFLSILYDEIAANVSLLSDDAKNEFDSWLPIDTLVVDKSNYFNELFMPIAIHNILKKELNVPKLFNNVKLFDRTLDVMQNEIKRSKNNLLDVKNVLDDISADALRVYSMLEDNNEPLVFNQYEMSDLDYTLKGLKNKLTTVGSEGNEFVVHAFVTRCEELLKNGRVREYAKIVIELSNALDEYSGFTKSDILSLIIALYPICPYIAEDIYQELFISRYSLINEGWPS